MPMYLLQLLTLTLPNTQRKKRKKKAIRFKITMYEVPCSFCNDIKTLLKSSSPSKVFGLGGNRRKLGTKITS